jgi:mannosyltransferase
MRVAPYASQHGSPTVSSHRKTAHGADNLPIPQSGLRLWSIVGGLTALALALGLLRVGAKSIWLDEAFSIQDARGGIGSLAHVLTRDDPNMGLYYSLLYGWVHLFGESEFVVRSLSAVFAALAVPVVYLLGRRLFGTAAGIVAALLLAVDAFFVEYAQEARSYSLVVLLVTLSSYFFVGELEQPSARTRIAYVLASALAVYAHYFAFYVLVAQLLTLLASRGRAAFTRGWMIAAGAIVLLCTPEAIVAYRHGSSGISWIPKPTLSSPKDLFLDLVGGSRTLLVIYFLAGCYTAALLFRSRERWRYGYVVAWLGVPILASFAVSFVQPMFLSKYLIVSLPALVLVAAVAITSVRRPVVAAVLVLAIVTLSALRVAAWYQRNSLEDWGGATRYVVANMHPGDGVVFFPEWSSVPVTYYERQDGASGLENLDPRGQLVKGWNTKRRIWLVEREADAGRGQLDLQRLELALSRTYRPAGQRTFAGTVGGTVIELFRRT